MVFFKMLFLSMVPGQALVAVRRFTGINLQPFVMRFFRNNRDVEHWAGKYFEANEKVWEGMRKALKAPKKD